MAKIVKNMYVYSFCILGVFFIMVKIAYSNKEAPQNELLNSVPLKPNTARNSKLTHQLLYFEAPPPNCGVGRLGTGAGVTITMSCTNCTPPIDVTVCDAPTDVFRCDIDVPIPCPAPTPTPTPTPCPQTQKPSEPCDPVYPSKKWEWLDCKWQCVAMGDDGGGSSCQWYETPCSVAPDCGDTTLYFCNGSGCCQATSPIIIDVNGNEINLTDAAGGVLFGFANRGSKMQLAWTARGSDDAWLALDRDRNGTIDDGAELFGNLTPQPPPPPGTEKHGFLALAEYDKLATGGNGDGQIDNRDSIFSSLRLWQDTNHNGISEPNELRSLPELKVTILHLDYKESRRRDRHGNQFRYRAKVTRDVHGVQVQHWAWDVFLTRRP